VTAGEWVAAGSCWFSFLPSGSRWLRVAQREHYLAGSVTRFALRWWVHVRVNAPLLLLGLAAVVLSWFFPVAGTATAGVAILAPLWLSVRGRTSALAWTRRLRTLAVVWGALEAGTVAIGFAVGRAAFFSAAAVVLCASMVDLACLLTLPLERWVASRYVAEAAQKLRSVNPRIVGITGSFGKTSTKNYITHLLAESFRVVATPASFNNRAGLARAVNENLVAGTEVFVAEMGTYGRGEIAELCAWCPPEVAVITAIGPVHLERFGSEEAIVEAKAEITSGATTVVLNTDDTRLAKLADQLIEGAAGPVVIRCSSIDRSADVCVVDRSGACDVFVRGAQIAVGIPLESGVQTSNVACAIGVGLHFGASPEKLAAGIRDLPAVPHRLTVGRAPSGVVVIDDTFNSNPAGARAALRVLEAAGEHGRRVVVTPGMVELGRRQKDENSVFAQASLEVASELVIVGRTNRASLSSPGATERVITVRTREDGVRWVREHLVAGDVVLYENDLPDHYP